MFLGLPDTLVTSTDPAQDPSIIKQNNSEKNLDFSFFATSLWIFTGVPDPHPNPLDRGTDPTPEMSRIHNPEDN